MEQPPQAAPRKKSQAASSSGVVLPAYAVTTLQLTLLMCVVTLLLYVFFGTGDEMSCGGLSNKAVCYLPGIEWLDIVLAVCFSLIFVSFLMIQPKSK